MSGVWLGLGLALAASMALNLGYLLQQGREMRQVRGGDDEVDDILLFSFPIKRRERCDAGSDFNARSTEKLLDSPSREGRFGGDDNLDHGLGSCGLGLRWPSNAA